MQAYGLIIAVFVNIFSKETSRQGKAGGLGGSRGGRSYSERRQQNVFGILSLKIGGTFYFFYNASATEMIDLSIFIRNACH